MTESFAGTLQHDAEAGRPDQQTQPSPVPSATARPVVGGGGSGQAHKPLSLPAVLRHVMLLEQPAAREQREAVPASEPALHRVNRVLDAALATCLQLDTARQQLQHAIATQSELEIVLEMLAARVESGHADPAERRQVASCLNSASDSVAKVVGEWHRVGRRFSQLTGLLPIQLDAGFETVGLVPPDEMDRLADACLSSQADVTVSLRQRAHAWAVQRSDPSHEGGSGPEAFEAWLSKLEETRTQAAADFAGARETYLQAVLNFDREHACLVRARSLRRIAETGFRLNTRRASDFADAILEESRRNLAVLTFHANRQVAVYHLYALAGLLPRQFGLIEPAAGH